MTLVGYFKDTLPNQYHYFSLQTNKENYGQFIYDVFGLGHGLANLGNIEKKEPYLNI